MLLGNNKNLWVSRPWVHILLLGLLRPVSRTIKHHLTTLAKPSFVNMYGTLKTVTLWDWSKSFGGVGRSREGVGHEVLCLAQGVGRAIFSNP